MAWYDRILGRTPKDDVDEKLNPSQYLIANDEGGTLSTREVITNYKTPMSN